MFEGNHIIYIYIYIYLYIYVWSLVLQSLNIWNESLNILNISLSIWNESLSIWNESLNVLNISLNILNISLNILNICNSEWLLSIKEETFIGCNANMFGDSRDLLEHSLSHNLTSFPCKLWTFTRYHKYSDSNAKCSLIQ